MRVRPLPKNWLIHSIEYRGFTGLKDDFQKPVYDEVITIKNVRFDDSTVFSRDSRETKIIANGVIFFDVVNSSPMPVFKEESKIKFNGREYTLKKIITLYHPKGNSVRHYELEVI